MSMEPIFYTYFGFSFLKAHEVWVYSNRVEFKPSLYSVGRKSVPFSQISSMEDRGLVHIHTTGGEDYRLVLKSEYKSQLLNIYNEFLAKS